MRSIFSKTVNDERVSINQGTFDATGIESGWADLLVVAQVCCASIPEYLDEVGTLTRPSTGARTMNLQLSNSTASSN